nr:Chain M, Linker L1 [Glossoscolex paulistus]4U8U_b Chain b, Linker L1 [Glossoscolex paulistus]4U8U_q Chain q, Linker L1 [Glossoscolex paulistus]
SDTYKDRRFQYILTNQHLFIDKLERDLHEIDDEFKKLGSDVKDQTVRHLKARISNLEGDDCKEHEAPCGGDVPQCISDLFFCDGHKDCKNGRDEDKEVCSEVPADIGSSFAGVVSWQACEEATPHHAVVTITANERKEFFKPRIWVRAILAFEEEEHEHHIKTFQLRGYYSFGDRTLALGPERGTKPVYGVRCHFDRGDDDHADCQIVNPASLFVCGNFAAERH